MGFTVWQAICRPRHAFKTTFPPNATYHDLEGTRHYTWRALRRQSIDNMSKYLLEILIFTVVSKCLGPGSHSLLSDKVPMEDEYGIAFSLGKIASWAFALIVSLFVMVLWYPLFMWLPSPPAHKTVTKTITNSDGITTTTTTVERSAFMSAIENLNYYAYTLFASLSLAQFTYHLLLMLVFVDSRPKKVTKTFSNLPTSTRRNWTVRLGLLTGILGSLGLGAMAMWVWYHLELVHVTEIEYVMIIVPIQILIGTILASIVQHLIEDESSKQAKKEVDYFDRGENGELTEEGVRKVMTVLLDSDLGVEGLRDIIKNTPRQGQDEGESRKRMQDAEIVEVGNEENKIEGSEKGPVIDN